MANQKEIRIYTIAGTKWKLEPLVYPKWLEALELIMQFGELFSAETNSFESIAKDAYKAGYAPRLFKIALKPYTPTMWEWCKHWTLRIVRRVRRGYLVKTLDFEDISEIIRDFFFINTKWMSSLNSTADASGTSQKTLNLMQTLMGFAAVFPSTISSSPSAKETSGDSRQEEDSSKQAQPSP